MLRRLILASVVFLAAASVAMAAGQTVAEGFENGIPAIWTTVNHSNPVGTYWDAPWHQDMNTSDTNIPAHTGTYYACADAASTVYDANGVYIDRGTIDNWLITPPLNVTAGNNTLTFWTQARSHNGDTLQVLYSTKGGSLNNGKAVADLNLTAPDPTDPSTYGLFPAYRAGVEANVGDFSTNLLTVNPMDGHDADYPVFQGQPYDNYPLTWTQYTVTLPVGVGRVAFRYLVHDGGYSGGNSWVIAVDDVVTPQQLLQGDTNTDGKVSFADYIALANNFGQTGATWTMGDFNGDGKVSFADYILLANNFGQSIPEPATLSLLALGGLGLIRRRK